MITVGVDPGQNGWCCVLNDEARLKCHVWRLPHRAKQLDVEKFGAALLDSAGIETPTRAVVRQTILQAVVEEPKFFPGKQQGLLTLALEAGALFGALQLVGIPTELVPAARWQGIMLSRHSAKANTKVLARERALLEYPDSSLPVDAYDAVCLAIYAKGVVKK